MVASLLFENPMNSPPGLELWQPMHLPGVCGGVTTVTTFSCPTENPFNAEPLDVVQ